MQGRESENKSNIQQFRMAMWNFRKACEMPKRSTSYKTESKVVKNEFRIVCETEENEFRKPCETKAEENEFRKPCEILPV